MEKKFINANTLYLKSLKLGKTILDSNFVPDILIALWRGGTPVGIVIHELFRYSGKDIKFHKAIRTESYRGINNQTKIKIEEFPDLIKKLNSKTKLLIVDDIFDSGKTLNAIVDKIKDSNKNPIIKIATIYYKPKNNITNICPDFYLHKTNAWLVFPHEFDGLTKAEIKKKNKKEYDILFDKI